MRNVHPAACWTVILTFTMGCAALMTGCSSIFGIEVLPEQTDTSVGGTGGGGGAGSGAGGTGGMGDCSDIDADGDEVNACDDCNDDDETVYPGRAEICGNDKDDNCEKGADEGCGGLGTYVSSLIGSDDNPGTQAEPVETIGKAIENAESIGGEQTVFVGEGQYFAAVTMANEISVTGGYCCDTNECEWTQNIGSCESVLDVDTVPAVHFGTTVTKDTSLSGFTIPGTSLGGVPSELHATVLVEGAGTIDFNTIQGPDVACSEFECVTAGVAVVGDDGSSLDFNTITGGTSTAAASTAVLVTAGASLKNNDLFGGTGQRVKALVVRLDSNVNAIVSGNIITSGTCQGSDPVVYGAELVNDQAGTGRIEFARNEVNVTHTAGNCSNCVDGFPCSGVAVFGARDIDVKSNIVAGIRDVDLGAAVTIFGLGTGVGVLEINGNTLIAPEGAGTAHAAVATWAEGGASVSRGVLRNNILLGAYGIYEASGPGTQVTPETVEHNAFDPSSDGAWRRWDGSSETLEVNSDAVNALGFGDGNIDDDCALDVLLRLTESSDCIDAGVNTNVPPLDIDGEQRPQNDTMDIGADERGS